MVMHYPNGQPYRTKQLSLKKSPYASSTLYGNRGMTLEEEINESNQYYLKQGIAVIHKKPIPIQIVNVDYPKRSAAVIKEAYFKQPSTTDYNGVYKGHYLDFEAKETKNLTAFPLANFHAHQIEHMKACQKQGGICFTILRFTSLKEVFLMPASLLFQYWDNQQANNGRKSIPYEIIKKQCAHITYQLQPKIPYLTYVDKLLEQIL